MPVVCALAVGCDDPTAFEPITAPAPTGNGRITVLPRTPYLATHPCMEQCHSDLEPNVQPRTFTEFHTGKRLDHGATLVWCTWCHKSDDLDQLRMFDGTPINFNDSHRICGQCHGEKHRDWERGIHGLQSGSWLNHRVRNNCPVCHNPHAPARPQFQPLPPPQASRSGAAVRPNEGEGHAADDGATGGHPESTAEEGAHQ